MNHRKGAAIATSSSQTGSEYPPAHSPDTSSSMIPAVQALYLRNTLSTQAVDELIARDDTLMVLPYTSGSRRACAPSKPGVIHSGLTLLGSEETLNEVWSVADEAISRGVTGNCYWSKTDTLIAAAIWLSPEACQDLVASTRSAYTELLQFLQNTGYPYPFRFWNYIPDINLGDGDNEHYKLFCSGRLAAFRAMGIPDDQFPSASALGHHSEGAVIYVLAAKTSGNHHNNALQVNAYQYPREYGESSPSFSRATCIKLGNQDLFFVSGTASIVGHKTTCEGDLEGQVKTTVSNIQHLLDNKAKNNNQSTLKSMKVYLRHASDFIPTKALLENAFPNTLMIYTLADVCRANLLVEVECFCG